MDNLNALKIGYRLKEYEIVEVLGIGGFGITYLAIDTKIDKKVVIKEYFPNELVVRESNTTVTPNSTKSNKFYDKGLDRFLQEAKILAKFRHPNIVYISRFIDDENNTAYFVMDYEEGEDLEEVLNRVDRSFTEDEILNIIMPTLDGLKAVHKEGLFHRDIKPANIFIRKNSTPMLIDFGAAREEFRSESRSFSSLNPHTPEYAPFEQISGDVSKIGAFSDIYSIGAVLYRLVMDKTPIKSIDRSHALLEGEADLYESVYEKLKGKYSDNLLKAIDKALSFKTKDRFQSVEEFQKALYLKEIKERAIEQNINKVEISETKKSQKLEKEDSKGLGNYAIFAIIISLIVAGGSYWQFILNKKYSLRLDIEPKSSNIYIDGIGQYYDGIKLKEGEYFINISKSGFVTKKQYIFLDSDKSLSIKLKSSYKQKWNRAIYRGKRSYSKNSKNTVKDNYTGLIWQKADDGKKRSWEEAKSYCSNLRLDGYSNWRLPELKELYYLADRGRYKPAVDSSYFDLESSYYWSATEVKSDSSDSWVVYFYNGNDGWRSKTNGNYVLCVEDSE